jgi:hypothetical protein
MLIFKTHDEYYVFIHIPKNSGKYLRKTIISNKKNKILKNYWNIKAGLDLAHIPYMMKNNFINNDVEYKYFTYSRNPYDRIISAFFYKNPNKTIDDFRHFVKKTLITYKFTMSFDYKIIHYYPQYLFICDENLDIPQHIKIDKLEDIESPKKYELTKYFDDECLNIINDLYSKDFLFFNYQKIAIINEHTGVLNVQKSNPNPVANRLIKIRFHKRF